MRCVAGAGLLALVGCNQIFGITPTRPYDAAVDVPPDMPHVLLDWQIAKVFAADSARPGAPDPTVVFAPIDPPPRIRIALLEDPAAMPGDPSLPLPALTPADYSPGDGFILIPRDYVMQPWRLEYTLADNVPHEVQWLPDDKQGHLTVPMFGRLQRNPPPSGSGYTITPSSPPASYGLPRVFTTGLWTEGIILPTPPPPTINYGFAGAISLSGATGSPDPALGDQALVVDYINDVPSGCRVAVGSAPIVPPTLQAGMHSVVTPKWDAGRKAVKSDAVDLTFITRLTDGLGTLGAFDRTLSFQLFGSAASIDLPGLAGLPGSSMLEGATLPVPVMITLLRCPVTNIAVLPLTAQPTLLDDFSRVLNVQIVATRKFLGATLTSGMETVVAATAAAATSVGLKIAFPAPIPTKIMLATPANAMVDLGGATDQVAIGPASGTFTLGFTPEVGPDLRGDYYDVVLHRIVGGALTTERIYTVTAPTVRIDGSLFAPGADYVFEVRSYKGHPRAQHGDFSAVDYPYGSAIVFTRTFKAS
jgi:hypothetical protein